MALDIEDRKLLGSEIVLPSKGLPYEGKLTGGVVTVVAMTTKEEKLMSGFSPNQGLSNVDLIIRRCVPTITEAGLKPDDLTVTDRLFLLVMIRTVTYGSEYNVSVRCTACGQKMHHTIKLPHDLDIYHLSDDFVEPFEVELPYTKSTVGLRLLRGSDERSVAKYTERLLPHANAAGGDPAYSYRMAHHVVYVNKEDGTSLENKTSGDMGAVNAWFDSLPAGDTASFRQAIADNDSGFDTETDLTCGRCSNIFSVGLPMQASFFRPGGERRSNLRRGMGTDISS